MRIQVLIIATCVACSANDGVIGECPGVSMGCGEGVDSGPGDTADTAVVDTAPPIPLTECERLERQGPSLTVGSGELEHSPVDDDDVLDVIYGPQGGWHVFGSLRTTGVKAGPPDILIHPDTPVITFELVDGDEVFGGYQSLPRPLNELGFGELEMFGEPLILWVKSPEPFYERPVTLRATLSDGCGTVVHDQHTVSLSPASALTSP